MHRWVRREAGDSGILAETTKLSSCPEASSPPTIHFGGNDDILYIQKDLYIALNSPPITIMTSLYSQEDPCRAGACHSNHVALGIARAMQG